MDRITNSGTVMTENEMVLEDVDQSIAQYEKLRIRISQLLKESNEAKEKGQWQKAQNLILEIRKITREKIDKRT
jgi:hypothetical protein